ncbi:uncharacterized protein Z518_00509 [Rhinocladiella mackenziei CBS 650.93]|uniref:Carrier domain-containing protein n=1 Tax=Rhinocladiella mackenziei CBS 650.93 TaxID=1442369 RepID=A0A0D2ITL2_9EURO|nr:uncharacterized protein Z518_00509 [Rhinocladiella mackenziei CBS 650.93]KIX09429.1 hypothetical protein Z518_00509 [Rhinocladiella mackenziei CBS 650.93]
MAHIDDKIEPIAIVGLSCRFPGDASNPNNLWDMMSNARRGHSKIPADRFNADTWYHPSHDRRGAVNVKDGFFLKEDVSLFDAPFFSITAKEASGMDPMQRLLLEVSYETFENAGVPIDQLVGSKTSVFCGCFTGDYDLLSNHDIFDHAPNAATGTGRAMLSNRVSWFYDLRGASFTVDTACSSSLYALHSACQSLRLGESKQALVTGSNLVLYPSMMHSLTNMHFLSPDGICHSFDDRANGYARGEAIGGLLLKPLKQALTDGDTIRAVIRGSGANQDGKTPGITQPSPESQADLIRFTYQEAGLSFNDTGYFEAHGTGTALGDPMELSAIGQTFGRAREASKEPLYVGSIKTNIGHTEGCSGLAGVIKSVLCLEKGLIPPNAGFEKINPKLRLDDWKLALPMSTMPWPSPGLRRISVNSFGYGGANAHVILDDAYHYMKSRGIMGNHSTAVEDETGSDSGVSVGGASTPPSHPDVSSRSGDKKLFVFSAQDQAGLPRMAAKYRDSLVDKADKETKESLGDQAAYLDDLAYTLASRRTKFDYRSFAVADSTSTLAASLTKGLPKLKRASKDDNIMFVCTGQGAQWPQMGRQLLSNPVFRAATAESQKYLESFGCEWDVFEELEKEGSESRIDSPEFSQPICSVLQISLIELLRHWGVVPKATVGHSSGEIAAAYAAGYLSHEDAIKIAYWRGVYSADVGNRLGDRKGIMMAAGVSEEEAQEYLKQVPEGSAVVACINSPSSVTLSGDDSSVSELERLLQAQGKFARKLRVKTAYHSPHMQVIADDYLKAMGDLTPLKGNGAVMYSSVSGKLAAPTELDASYWVRNMVSAVRFNDAVTGLLLHSQSKGRRKTPVKWSAAIEVGPHEALKGPVNQIMAAVDNKLSSTITYAAPVLRGKDAEMTALEAAGHLWASGHTIDLAKVNGQDNQLSKTKVLSDLPTYPWNHSKGFWYEPRMTTAKRFKKEPRTDLLGAPIDNQNDLEPHWRNILRIPENPWMAHHEITGTILYPGAGMLIMAIEAARQLANPEKTLKGIELQDVTFGRGLVIPSADEAVETSLSLRPYKALPDCYSWTLFSLPPGSNSWTENSSGLVSLVYAPSEEVEDTEWRHHAAVYEDIKKTSTKDVNIETFYKDLQAIGMNYGTLFQNLTQAQASPDTHRAHGTVTIPDTKAIMPHNFEYPHWIHPATLDAIFHLLFIGFTAGEPMKEAAVPINMEKMYISANTPQGAGAKYVGYTEGTMIDGRDLAGKLVLSDEEWSEPKVIISIAAREVSSHDSGSHADDNSDETKRTAVPIWKEDLDIMSTSEAESFLKVNGGESNSQLALLLDRACHKDADLRALFFTTDVSSDLNEALLKLAPLNNQRLRFQQCTVVSQNQSTLDTMKAQLDSDGLSITYKTIDLDAAVSEQGFSTESYDCAIIGASDFRRTATALKPLVAQGGKLIITGDKPADVAGREAWHSALAEAGNYDLGLCMENEKTVLVTGFVGYAEESTSELQDLVLLRRAEISSGLSILLDKLVEKFSSKGFNTQIATLDAAVDVKDKGVLSFLEAETPLVINWTSGELEHFKRIVASNPYMLWVTRGGQVITRDSIPFAVATGMLRTVRTEVPQITLPHIDLSPGANLEADTTIDLVLKVFDSTARDSPKTPEMEYAETDGKVMICRVIEDKSMDRELELYSVNVRPVMAPLHQTNRPLKLAYDGQSGAANIRWLDDEEPAAELAPSGVEIQVSAISLTENDLPSISKGSVGRDAAGTVTRVGSDVSEFKPGQQVAVIGSGTCKTHLSQDKSLVRAIPAGLSPETVVGLPIIYAAAYHALFNLAHISSLDKVLIESAHTALGQAAVQLAKSTGADVVAAGDIASRSTLVSYGVPEDHIFDESKEWQPQLARWVGGFDIVFSSASGKTLRSLCSLVNDFGRFVNMNSDADVDQLHATIFKRNISYANVDFDHLVNARGSLMSSLVTKVFDKLEAKEIGSLPRAFQSASELKDAVESLESKQTRGIITLNFGEDAMVPTTPEKPAPLQLDPTATYILSGGLGGLGANIAETMFQGGARHLVFLSRSGATTPAQKALLAGFEARGCKVDAPQCDISDASQLAQIRATAAEKGWRIKGVMQLAMVLRDSVLENMTYDKWVGATQCKIPGTWNLHTYMPEDLDFFIALSSVVSVIGNTGQANYAAGNSYIDALCNYRRSQGLAGTSLNIGLVNDATHFTADFTVEDFLALYGHLVPVQVADREVNIAIEAAMRGHTADGVTVPPQVVVGIRADLDREGSVTSLWPKDRKFDHRASTSTDSTSGDGKVKLKTVLSGATSVSEATDAVEDALKSNVANSMGSLPEDVDADKPLHSFGIDSLKAVEVRNWLFREVKADVSVFEILSPMPLKKLAIMIVSKSKFVNEDVAKGASEELRE